MRRDVCRARIDRRREAPISIEPRKPPAHRQDASPGRAACVLQPFQNTQQLVIATRSLANRR
jgi:hypothetical protein